MSATVVPIDRGAGETIMLVAVEPSGDALGAALFRELRKSSPAGTRFIGCGGPLMEAEGFGSLFPIDALSVMGFTDVARALPEAYKRADELTAIAAGERVDAVVFIDGWAFSRLCATRMKKRAPGARLFKFAAPQVWASRPQRVGFVRKHFDGVLCLLPFEPEWFEKAGVRAEFVGNPNFQAAWNARGDAARFRARWGIGAAPLLAILPGSRKSEVRRLIEPFAGAVSLLRERVEGLEVVIPVAPSVADLVNRKTADWPVRPILVEPDEKYDAFAAATAAIAKSGTVTTELAINRTPMVVAYKVDPVTSFWAHRVVTTPFATILNVTAGDFVVPELLQRQCTPEYLAGAALPLLTGGEARTDQLEAFPPLLASLGVDGPPAAQAAAEKIREWMGPGRS